nr:hypothetical protein [Tanacetum cinerariifolium]
DAGASSGFPPEAFSIAGLLLDKLEELGAGGRGEAHEVEAGGVGVGGHGQLLGLPGLGLAAGQLLHEAALGVVHSQGVGLGERQREAELQLVAEGVGVAAQGQFQGDGRAVHRAGRGLSRGGGSLGSLGSRAGSRVSGQHRDADGSRVAADQG